MTAHLADLEQEMAPKKRRKGTSPTARTLAECRKRGWIAQVVEHRVPRMQITRDLFNVIDVVALDDGTMVPRAGGGRILGIQACAGASHAARRDKILAEPKARAWVAAGGHLELWSWSKRGGRHVTRKKWELRVEAFTAESWPAEALAAIGATTDALR